MKLTNVLFKTNLHRMYMKKWRIQRHRKIVGSDVTPKLVNKDILVIDAGEVARPENIFKKVDIVQTFPPALSPEEGHPDWHDRVCHIFNENTSLIEGMDQAQALTKTIHLGNNFPKQIEDLLKIQDCSYQDELVKRNILSSFVYDARQDLLPKVILPEKPHFNLPREYGIPLARANDLLCRRLLHLCSLNSARLPSTSLRFVKHEGRVESVVEKDGDLVKFHVTGNHMVFSSKPLPQLATSDDLNNAEMRQLPDIYPLANTVALNKEHIYCLDDVFPVNTESPCPHAHTVIFHHNIHDSGWTESQFCGATLVKGFGIAVAQAKQKFGEKVRQLPSPVCLLVVHTDGKMYHFGVLQLNTLDISNTGGVKNVFWSIPPKHIFTSCAYSNGKPELKGYNPEVFCLFSAFYNADL